MVKRGPCAPCGGALISLLSCLVVLLVCAIMPIYATRSGYRHLIVCPNGCSGNGVCLNATFTQASGECSCFPGFAGSDCSQRMCPSGTAWVDFPYANNTAHANYTECSNMGVCNRVTGQCQCRFGFGGAACDAMVCPMSPQVNCVVSTRYRFCGNYAVCGGHGKCMSLRYAAALKDYNTLWDSTQYIGWDADMIHGCVCDDGWEGPNCDQQICPKGDNPDTTDQVDEVQLLDCKCSHCGGGLYLTINGKATGYIPYTAKEEVVKHMIDKTGVLERYTLKIVGGQSICSAAGSTTSLTFHVPSGPQDAMIITPAGGLHGTISVRTGRKWSKINTDMQARKGTKEYIPCSGQGICNATGGTCSCYTRYGSSDGMGGSGTRGDCGFEKYGFADIWLADGTVLNTSCPVIDGNMCSGNGHCENGDKVSAYSYCVCDLGWSKFQFLLRVYTCY
jgi:hypothetical protein